MDKGIENMREYEKYKKLLSIPQKGELENEIVFENRNEIIIAN